MQKQSRILIINERRITMKKSLIAILILMLALTGCGNKGKEKKSDSEPKQSQSQQKTGGASKDSPAESSGKNPNVSIPPETKDGQGSQGSSEPQTEVKDKDGNIVTSEQLIELINESNDPNTDEATKKKLLEQIDYILKQLNETQKSE